MHKKTNLLPLLSASIALSALGMLAMTSTSASASSTYYTCDAPTNCKQVDKRYLTTSYNDTKYPIVLVHGFLGELSRLFCRRGQGDTRGQSGPPLWLALSS